MKKHNEGYVLAFVLIVVAVLALISTAVSTVAVRNMETQQAAVKRMQLKYEAEGAVEIVLSQLADVTFNAVDGEEKALDDKITELCNPVRTDNDLVVVQTNISETTFNKDNDGFVYQLTLEVQKASETMLTYQVEIKGTIEDTKINVQTYTYMSFEEGAV